MPKASVVSVKALRMELWECLHLKQERDSTMSQIRFPQDLAIRTTATSGRLTHYLPEPKSSVGGTFQSIVRQVASSVASVGTGGMVDLGSLGTDFQELLVQQMEAQRQMMSLSMLSNVERTKHETKMAAVRNLRVA